MIAGLSLSACSTHVAATPKARSDPQVVAAAKKAAVEAKKTAAAAKKTAACGRVVAITSNLADIQVQIFQSMSVGNESGVWGPIVADLDRQKVVLNTEMTAKKLVCGGPVASKTATSSARATPAPGRPRPKKVSKVKVDLLTWKVDRDPRDKVSLRELADLYFSADDFENASAWDQKILDFAPEDGPTLVTLGVAQYNLGHDTEAEKQWRVAEWLDPYSVEAHYNLGFLYKEQTPPDTAKMKAQWQQVMELAPDSDWSRLVAPHMK